MLIAAAIAAGLLFANPPAQLRQSETPAPLSWDDQGFQTEPKRRRVPLVPIERPVPPPEPRPIDRLRVPAPGVATATVAAPRPPPPRPARTSSVAIVSPAPEERPREPLVEALSRTSSVALEPQGAPLELTARTRGEEGESCRAALDCQSYLRCVAHQCVLPAPLAASSSPIRTVDARPRPPSRERSRLRIGVEVSPGFGQLYLERRDLVGAPSATELEEIRFAGGVIGTLELGLDRDQLLLALGSGIAWPAGLDGREPSLQVDLRAGWRLWSGREGVAFYLEPRVETWFGGVPGPFGWGGALAARMRVDWLDTGIRIGGLIGGEGNRRLSDISVVEERLTVLTTTFFLAANPILAAW
ncbi:MAG: hypothetical protein AAFZ18_13950 [Myxococcota bacterium]